MRETNESRRQLIVRLFLLATLSQLSLVLAQESASCLITSIDVSLLANGRGLAPIDVSAHIKQGINWTNPNTTEWSCVDGRSWDPILGTPGGDSGEFILALTVFENLRGVQLLFSEIQTLFEQYIENLAPGRQFYMHTDEHTVDALRVALNDSTFQPENYVEPADQERILSYLTNTTFIGCGHVKLMLNRSQDYMVRKELVISFLRTYFDFLWNHELAGKITHKTDFVELSGEHAERAVVLLDTDPSEVSPEDPCYGLAPMVPSSNKLNSFFLHQQSFAKTSVRVQLADFFQKRISPSSNHTFLEFITQMNAIAAIQIANTLAVLAVGEPIYYAMIHVKSNITNIPTSTSTSTSSPSMTMLPYIVIGDSGPPYATLLFVGVGVLVMVILVVYLVRYRNTLLYREEEERTPLISKV